MQEASAGFRRTLLHSVEARGFEPRSEIRSTTASTCVSRWLRSPETGQRAAHPRTSLL